MEGIAQYKMREHEILKKKALLNTPRKKGEKFGPYLGRLTQEYNKLDKLWNSKKERESDDIEDFFGL